MAIKTVKNTSGHDIIKHTNLLDIDSSYLGNNALRLKAAAVAWIVGDLTENEVIEAIAEKWFSEKGTHTFMGDPWNEDPIDYISNFWEEYRTTERDLIEAGEFDEIIDQDDQSISLEAETEMEKV